MAFITIITGSHEFRDDFNYFSAAFLKPQIYRYEVDGVIFNKSRFERVIITKDNQVIYLPPIIASVGYGQYSCTQTMGSGKTILGVEHLARIHKNSGNTDANLSIKWFKENHEKDKKEWVPSINSLEDFQKANRTTILFDDIKHTISRWNAEESEFISAIVNQSRKEQLNIIITTQRVINFVPPNIREVVTNYEIPYVTIRDQRSYSPDGMGMPVEMEVLNISANGVFIGFGLFNGLVCDGTTIMPTKRLLESYSTLEVAVDLKGKTKTRGKTDPTKYIGYENEMKVIKDLQKFEGVTKHLALENSHEHIADIQFNNGRIWLIDAVACNPRRSNGYEYLITQHKDLFTKCELPRQTLDNYLIAFEHDNKIKYVKLEYFKNKKGNVAVSKKLKDRMFTGVKFFKEKEIKLDP